MRHFDTPDLFGEGFGSGTCGDIYCDVCKTLFNEGNDKNEQYDGESVGFTNFAGLTVCDCCFERVENEVEQRMPQILVWYRAIVEKRREDVAKDVRLLDDIGLDRRPR